MSGPDLVEAFADAVEAAHIRELQAQLRDARAECDRLREAGRVRESQLVRYYGRKLRLTRWFYRLALCRRGGAR